MVNQVGGGDQISGGGQKNVGNNSAKVIGVIAAAFAVCATAIVWIVFYTRPPHNGGDPAPPENLAIPAGQPEIQ